MTRSKLSTKALLLATGIGLSIAAFAGSQPAAAQSYSYTCPDGFVYDPTYGCTTLGGDDYGYYGYPTILYGQHPHHDGFDHGFGHGMGGFGHSDRGVGLAHFGGGARFGGGAHFGGAGLGHAMAGGFGHGGGGGHR
jgi:hypothetical protein